MAAGVAHEIANPLASMDSLLQLMQRRPERLRPEALVTLRAQIARIHAIVQQMTTFAHPHDSAWQTVSLNDTVEHVLGMLELDPRMAKVQVQRELDPQTGTLSAQPHALQQVLVNLIINALDAMAQTPAPVLKIRSRRDGEACYLEVADNGHGIDPKHQHRLFEPFFTTKPVGKGTGLGLAISYSLVRKHGGQIDVQSALGVGTSFTIRLPLTAASGFPASGTDLPQALPA